MAASADSLKIYPTLKGYAKAVVEQLTEARGVTPTEVGEWIITTWIDASTKLLKEEYGISRGEYRRAQSGGPVRLVRE